jgi:hypothetical protein
MRSDQLFAGIVRRRVYRVRADSNCGVRQCGKQNLKGLGKVIEDLVSVSLVKLESFRVRSRNAN